MDRIFIDTHTHYDDEKFDPDRESVISELIHKGVKCVINAGSDVESSQRSMDLAAKHDFMRFAAGIHPHCAQSAPPDFEAALASFFSAAGKAVAVGEIGLDYYYDFSPRETQKEVFARQLVFSGKVGAPVVIHNRLSDNDIIDIIKAHINSIVGGVFHCFSGDRQLARKALDLGFHISFGGSLTFKKSFDIAEAAAYAPDDRIMMETDCPYMSPEPYRGRRNDSSRIGLIAARIAQIRNVSLEETARITSENAGRLFAV